MCFKKISSFWVTIFSIFSQDKSAFPWGKTCDCASEAVFLEAKLIIRRKIVDFFIIFKYGFDKKNATPKPHKVRKRVFLAIFWKRRFSLRGHWLHVEDMNAALKCHLSGPLLYMVPTVFSKARDFEKFWKKSKPEK